VHRTIKRKELYAKTNLSTQEKEAQDDSWFSCAHAYPWRKACYTTQTSHWAQKISRINSSPLLRGLFCIYTKFMLKKKERLSRRDFSTLLKKGRRCDFQYFSLIYRNAPEMKCGIVVSKKVAKNAIKRNLLRRRMYYVLGECKDVFFEKHVIFITKKDTETLPFPKLKEYMFEVVKLLQRYSSKILFYKVE